MTEHRTTTTEAPVASSDGSDDEKADRRAPDDSDHGPESKPDIGLAVPETPTTADGLIPDVLVQRIRVSKAVAKAGDLLALKPVDVAASVATEDRASYVSLANRMAEWAVALDDALATPNLRSVQ